MPKSRVESFSDCVAISLLILDIHLEGAGPNIDNTGMIQGLLALAPRFSIYVISFLICTVAWVSHHELIHDVDCVDSRLLWLNNLCRSPTRLAPPCPSRSPCRAETRPNRVIAGNVRFTVEGQRQPANGRRGSIVNE
jgi:hypothetical protein